VLNMLAAAKHKAVDIVTHRPLLSSTNSAAYISRDLQTAQSFNLNDNIYSSPNINLDLFIDYNFA